MSAEQTRPPAAVEDAPQNQSGTSDEIYMPVDAAIDDEAHQTVCCGECPPDKKPIVSVHGKDVDADSLPQSEAERAA